jgi:hypothetical protein
MTWVIIEPDRDNPEPEGLDPYENWARGEGRPFFFPRGKEQEWIPVAFRLVGITALQFAAGDGIFDEPTARANWRAIVRIPALYTSLPPQLENLEYITGFVKEEFFQLLRSQRDKPLDKFVKEVSLSLPLDRSSFPSDEPGELRVLKITVPSGPPAPNTVVVGIIDDGIAIANERFRNASDKTRVEYAWIQDAIPTSASAVPYGRELEKQDQGLVPGIGTLLSDCTHAGLLDEDEFYRRAGFIDLSLPGHKPIAASRAHGTHVMDLAAGFDRSNAPAWPLVCVQLPIATTADSSGALLPGPLIDGIIYILLRSLAIASDLKCGPLPVVVNLSYGFIAGPHDGTHYIERAIDRIVDLWTAATGTPLRIVIASGNSHIARVHAKIDLQSVSLPRTLYWRVLPDDQTPSILEIWLPYKAPPFPSRVNLTILPPGGPLSPSLGETNGMLMIWKPNGVELCRASYHFIPTSQRARFTVILKPTATLDPTVAIAPSGTWRVELHNVSLTSPDVIHAWIQRDDTPYGYPTRGRQSYFDDPTYRRFDEGGWEIEEDDPAYIITRAGSMNAMATGERTIVIGGHMRKEGRPAKYSAGGPITPKDGNTVPSRRGPDAMAVSDDSRVHAGVLGAGTRSGSVVAMSGTSVAAPMVTRWIAEQLAAGWLGNAGAVQGLANAYETAILPLPPPPKPSPERGGAGRIRRDPQYPSRRFESS